MKMTLTGNVSTMERHQLIYKCSNVRLLMFNHTLKRHVALSSRKNKKNVSYAASLSPQPKFDTIYTLLHADEIHVRAEG